MSLPSVYVKRISLSGASPLGVSIDFCILAGANLEERKRTKESLANDYKVLIVQCTSGPQIEQLKGLSAEKFVETLHSNAKTNFSDYRVLSVGKKQLDMIAKPNVGEVCFFTDEPFEIDRLDLSNLVYFFLPFREKADSTFTYGPPTIEVVFERGALRNEAFVFKRPDNSLYNGPMHWHEGTPMVGAAHTSEPHDTLTLSKAANQTIQDLRILEALNPPKERFLASIARKEKESESYFSDMYLSKSRAGGSGFFFSVDYTKIIRNNADFSWLLANDLKARQNIINRTRIKSLKILRRKVDKAPAVNKLGISSYRNSDSDAQSEVIAVFSDLASNAAKSNVHTVEVGEGQFQQVGSIQEVNLVSNTKEVRSFAGLDKSIVQAPRTKYCYGVELEFADESKNYFKSKQADLENATKVVEDYLNILETHGIKSKVACAGRSVHGSQVNKKYFDIDTRTFTRNLQIELDAKIGSENLFAAIKTYLEALSMMTNITIPAGSEGKVYSLVHPVNGTPEAIFMLFKNMNDLREDMERIADTAKKSVIGGEQAPSKKKAQPDGGEVVYKKWFDEMYDTSEQNLGRSYLTLTPGHGEAPQISVSAYRQSVELEHNKLFKSTSPIVVNNALALDVQSTKYSYLGPLIVKSDSQEDAGSTIWNVNDPSYYDVDLHNNILVDTLNFNNPDVSEETSFNSPTKDVSKSKYELRGKLINFFAVHGCTIESIEDFSSEKIRAANPGGQAIRGAQETVNIVDELVRAPKDLEAPDVNKVRQQTEYESDETNPNNILIRLIGAFAHDGNYDGIKPQEFNLNNKENRFTKISNVKINKFPNQVKALIAIHSDSVSNEVVNIDVSRLRGTHRDQDAWYQEHFMNIVEVQMLTGYEMANDGTMQLKKPIFKKVVDTDLKNLNADVALCRLRRYSNLEAGVPDSTQANIPIFGEHFIMAGAGANQETVNIVARREQTKVSKALALPTFVDPAFLKTDGGFPRLANAATKKAKSLKMPGKPVKRAKTRSAPTREQPTPRAPQRTRAPAAPRTTPRTTRGGGMGRGGGY